MLNLKKILSIEEKPKFSAMRLTPCSTALAIGSMLLLTEIHVIIYKYLNNDEFIIGLLYIYLFVSFFSVTYYEKIRIGFGNPNKFNEYNSIRLSEFIYKDIFRPGWIISQSIIRFPIMLYNEIVIAKRKYLGSSNKCNAVSLP